MSINLAVLSGRVGRDPEHKQVGQKGTDLATTSLAVNAGWGDRERTDWYTLNFWGNRAALADHINKGDKLTVVGDLELDEYETKDGETRQSVKVSVQSVEFMSGGSSKGNSSSSRSQSKPDPEPETQASFDDDLPF